MIVRMRDDEGKHSLLEQGSLFGGKIQKSRLQIGKDASAILTFHVELQDQLRDEFSIRTDGSVAYCKAPLSVDIQIHSRRLVFCSGQ